MGPRIPGSSSKPPRSSETRTRTCLVLADRTPPPPRNFPSRCVGVRSPALMGPWSWAWSSLSHPYFPACSLGNPGQSDRAGVQGPGLPQALGGSLLFLFETFPRFRQSPSRRLGPGHLHRLACPGHRKLGWGMKGWDPCWASFRRAAANRSDWAPGPRGGAWAGRGLSLSSAPNGVRLRMGSAGWLLGEERRQSRTVFPACF